MSVYAYCDQAKRHVLEFVDLGYFWREEDRKAVYQMALANPSSVESWIVDHRRLVHDLVALIPSRRMPWLKGLAGGDGPTQFVAILGAWQHCRKAVLAYEWLHDNEDRFTPGQSYRSATVSQGLLFEQLRPRRWTRWPCQWGASPFKGEQFRQEASDAEDYDEILDEYSPEPNTSR